jgi:hypothetical protein
MRPICCRLVRLSRLTLPPLPASDNEILSYYSRISFVVYKRTQNVRTRQFLFVNAGHFD